MATLIGDIGSGYYIKDVMVRSEYQKKWLGRTAPAAVPQG